MKLHQLQEAWCSAVIGDDDQALLPAIRNGGALAPRARVAIYRNNITGALCSAMEQVYPVCGRILGERYFRQVCRACIARYPSSDADLNLYGERLSTFLLDLQQTRADLREFPYLPGLAWLEWLYHAAYYAATDNHSDYSLLTESAGDMLPDLCFRPSRSLGLVASPYPLLAVWRANREDENADRVAASDGMEYLCVSRPRGRNRSIINVVEQPLFALLIAIAQNATLDALAERFPGLDRLLPEAVRRGWACPAPSQSSRS